MRSPIDIWQGCSDYWQSAFIRENLLPLGHAAWEGFVTQGRGMVVCDVAIANADLVDWSRNIVGYTAQFVPLAKVSAHLQTFNLETTLIEHLIDTGQTYDPVQSILLLINASGRVEISLLQNLAIPTAACYEQMQQRWSEFQITSPQ
ncbi:MAG: hypothetical protein AB4042_16155 [Leptolyngbyaceae cyanobacterium]